MWMNVNFCWIKASSVSLLENAILLMFERIIVFWFLQYTKIAWNMATNMLVITLHHMLPHNRRQCVTRKL